MHSLLLFVAMNLAVTLLPPPQSDEQSAPVQLALNSLKEFFHGKPAAPKKALPPKQRAVIAWDSSVARDAGVDTFLNAFADALMTRDASSLEPLVSKQYKVEGLPDGVTPIGVLRQAIEQMPGPTNMQVQSVAVSNSEKVARVEIRYERGEPRLRTIRMDGQGKLLSSDLFSVKVQVHSAVEKG